MLVEYVGFDSFELSLLDKTECSKYHNKTQMKPK